MSEEDGMDDWAAAMAEQADAESESEGGDDDGVRVAVGALERRARRPRREGRRRGRRVRVVG